MKPQGAKHRRSIRLKEYDYSQPGAYFVTIVTQGRLQLFGEIVDHQMQVNPAGEMVKAVWRSLENRFPVLELGTFTLMPNHLHGILVIRGDVGATFMVAQDRAGMNPAPTRTQKTGHPTVGDIVGTFKSLTTHAYIAGVKTAAWTPFTVRLWQRNYYEHVIRDSDDWNRTHLYIDSNPRNWEYDEEHPNRLRE